MKATELMIGDWILYGDKPVKVLQLSENSKYDWVEPIPLTPEILEKNDLPQYRWLKIYFQGDYGNITDFSKGITYVHELQHALRLCGLNELATNFKI